MAYSAPAARRSGRPQRKRMYIDTYEQLGRDEEKQLSEALKASLEDNSTGEEPVNPIAEPVRPVTKPVVKRGRGRPKSKKTLAKEKNEEAQPAETATDKQHDPENDNHKTDEPKTKKKKTIIRNKSASEGAPIKAQRKFAAVTANGKRNPSKRKPTPKPTPKQAPTLPPSEDCDDDGSKTEEFVDYLCLRKSVPTKSEWRSFSGEDEDSLVIAESEESACEDDI